MKQIGTFQSKRWGTVAVLRGTYLTEHGPISIHLEGEDGQLLTKLSVNMYRPQCSEDSRDLPPECFYVKEWEENQEIAAEALASGLFKARPDLPVARSGHVSSPAWEIVNAH